MPTTRPVRGVRDLFGRERGILDGLLHGQIGIARAVFMKR